MPAPPLVRQQALPELPATSRRGFFPLRGLTGWMILILIGLSVTPGQLLAESMIFLETPGVFENVRATTFDEKGRAVGTSSFEVMTDETGIRHMTVRMAIEGGGSNLSEAILAPIAGGITGSHGVGETVMPVGPRPPRAFRLLEERSQATRADGVSLDFLVIDHTKRRVSCYPPDRDLSKGKHIDLPKNDRVVNVPMQLLFRPLVSGEIKKLRFRTALCRDGPRLYKMLAVRGPKTQSAERDVVEIRFGPDLGDAIAWLASRFLARFSFWFDARDGDYLGHRMPLHRKGPEILLVRKGLTPSDIGLD